MRMQSARYMLFYPILLIAVLIGVDRLLTLPGILEQGRGEDTPVENLRGTVPIIHTRLKQTAGAATPPKRTALFVGTSRSLAFAQLTPERIAKNPLLSADQRALLGRYETNAGLALVLQDMLTTLQIVDAVAAEEDPVDLVVFEVPPYLLYGALVARTRWYDSVQGADFIERHFDVLPGGLRDDAMARWLFRTYDYKFRPERALSNLISPESAPIFDAATAMTMLRSTVDPEELFRPRIPGENPSAENLELLESEIKVLLGDGAYRDMDPSMALLPAYRRSIQMLRDADIDVVLWMSPVHRFLVDRVYRRHNTDGLLMSRYFDVIRETDLPYYNGNAVLDRCDEWHDAGHMAGRCYPLLAAEILRCHEDPELVGCRLREEPLDPLQRPDLYSK